MKIRQRPANHPDSPPLSRGVRGLAQSVRRLGPALVGLGLTLVVQWGAQAASSDCTQGRAPGDNRESEQILDAMSEQAPFDYLGSAQLCFVSPLDLKQSLGLGKTLIVDVRPQGDYSRAHIPGSLNILAYELWTKSFLRDWPIALVDNGFVQSELLRLCADLRERGWEDVSVVRGGLNAWRQAVGALAGTEPTFSRFDQVSPRDFYREQKYADIRLVDLSDLPGPGVAEAEAAQAIIGQNDKATADQNGASSSGRWNLVVTDSGRDYEYVRRAITSQRAGPLFYLEGGKSGYRDYLAQRAQMAKGKLSAGKKADCRRGSADQGRGG